MGLKDNLVSHIEFEDASGSFTDSYGSASFARRNSATTTTGKIGNALVGNESAYCDGNDIWSSDGSAVSFAIGCWVQLDAAIGSANYGIAAKFVTTGNNREWTLYYNGTTNRFVFAVSDAGTATNTSVSATTFGAPSTGTWYYVFAYHDAVNDVIGISVNDGTRDTAAHSTGVYAGTGDCEIGRYLSGEWYGLIDEMSFWRDIVPSTTDIATAYNSGAGLDFDSWPDDTTPPTISSAVIPAAGTTVVLTYSENVTATNESGFTLNSDGGAVTLSGLSGDGTNIHTYTLSRTIDFAETLDLDYNSATGSAVDDGANDLASFTGASVTNNSLSGSDITPPTLSTAVIPSAGTTLVLTYDENVTSTNANGFYLYSTGARVTLSGLSGDGTDTHTYTLSRTVLSTEILDVSYESDNGTAVDDSSNLMASFSGTAITNNSTQSPVTLSSAVIPSAGNTITLTFSGNATAVDSSGLTLESDYGRLTLTGLTGDGTSSHVYTLQRAVYGAETITLTYEPEYGAANIAAFDGTAVTNNSTQTEADFVYVSNTGDDGNDGTTSLLAVQTVTRALSLYASNNNSGALLFEKGGTWDATGITFNFGQGSSTRPLIRWGAYGTGDRPEITGIQVRNIGNGLYNATISDLIFIGAGQSEANDLLTLNKVVGSSNVVTFRNIKVQGYKKALTCIPFGGTLPSFVWLDSVIRDCWGIGTLYQKVGHVEMQRSELSRCALGNTPGVRDHNQFNHGSYPSSCYSVKMVDTLFNDNGSLNIKASSDYVDRVQPLIITDCVFVDGFHSIGMGASDILDIGAGNVRHRDVFIARNAFLRTRDTTTSRRVDTGSGATRDYYDRVITMQSAANAIIKHNAVTAVDPLLSDSTSSEADNFVDLDSASYNVNNRIGSNYLTFVGAEYNNSAFTLVEDDARTPVLMLALITAEGDELWLAWNRPVTGQTAFTITASGGAATLSSPAGNGTSLHRHAISRVLDMSETVTVSYDSGPGTSVDGDGTSVASFTNESVTNNSLVSSADVTAPTLLSAQISMDGLTLTLVFSEAVTGQTAFTITASGGAATLSSPAGNGSTTFTFTISRAIASSETVTLDYDSGTGTSADNSGNDLATISGQSVTHLGASVSASIAGTLIAIGVL